MLHIDTQDTLQFSTQFFVENCVAVLGIRGSGKTNTAAVLIEELLSQGLPMTIVDIEGEYYGLKQSYELLVAGRSEHAELEVSPDNAAQLAELSVKRGISVILDLSEYTQEEQYEFLVAYFKQLWETASSTKRPYQIVLEEAHEFIPQGASTPLKQLLTRIALRGRKRGLGIILISQRSAKVEKDVLTQTALLFLHKVVHPVDMKVYKDLIPLAGNEVEQMVSSLTKGQAVIVAHNVPQVAQVRLRYTFHAGATPEFGVVAQPELRKIDASLLKELQAALTKAEKSTGTSNEAKLAKRVQELEELLAAREAEIKELEAQNALLSKLSVAVESPQSLEINHATVNSMHVASPSTSRATVVETMISKAPVQVIAAPVNEQKLDMFKRRLGKIKPLHLAMLRLLTEKQQAMNVQQIAAWLNRSENSIINEPPHDLMRMGLIDRGGRPLYYVSKLRQYLATEFPGGDSDTLIQRLFGGR